MSERYVGGWEQAGLFNPLNAPTPTYLPYLYAWGGNSFGQLGLNNNNSYSSPVQVGALSNWITIAAGYKTAFGIKSNGTLWAWGTNNSGQLGLNNTTYYSSPKQVGALTNWSKISASNSTLAIKTDGTLWAWGQNIQGKLGLGNTTYYSSPKQVGTLTNWLNVSAGYLATLAIKTDGTLWAWGQNSFGNLGLGNTTNYSSPKQVGALNNWNSVLSTGVSGSFTIATKTDGTLWAWGRNNYGQLGLGNTTNYSSPVQIGALVNWNTLVSSSGSTTSIFAIKKDGTLWAWGYNGYGTLGLGNTTYYSSPKQVGALTNWLSISAVDSALAIKTNGTLWGWGYNTNGQLGLNNTTNYSSPKQIGTLSTWYRVSSMFQSTIATLY
jgi:alpha-tubulin suppressor-like RCC1 family protein